MDGRTPGVWCVLALLVVSAAVSHAVNSIQLESMTWSSTDGTDTVLTVCAADNLTAGFNTSRLTVRFINGTQDAYEEEGGDDDSDNCVIFTVTETLPRPEVEERTYELTTFTGNDLNDRGEVTFAFPLSQGTKIECGTPPGSTLFTRFSVEDGGGPALDGSNCLTDSTTSVCYISGNSDSVCVTGLDQSLTDPDAFEVCVPSDTTTLDVATITAVSLAYADGTDSNRFTISSDVDLSTTPTIFLELLSVIHSSGNDPSVTTCTENVCTFDSGDPSTKLYDLCSVYVDDGRVTSVGTHSIQDLQLTVDVVDTTVDFRFANLNSEGGFIYDAYGGNSAQNPPTDSFTLDCSHISATSFCNGFFDNEDSSLDFIGVSFSGSGDVVIAPTATQASVHLPKVKENAMDLTGPKY